MANFVLVHGACVKAPKFRDGAWLPNSTIVELKTGHDPMISEPAALVRMLLDCAA